MQISHNRNKWTDPILDTLQYPPNENSAVPNRRNLIDKTPKRTGEELVPTTPWFLLFMGTRPPWLGDYGPIWTRSLDFSVRDPNSEKSNRLVPQHTSPSNMLPPKILNPWLKLCPVSYTHLDVYKRQMDTHTRVLRRATSVCLVEDTRYDINVTK